MSRQDFWQHWLLTAQNWFYADCIAGISDGIAYSENGTPLKAFLIQLHRQCYWKGKSFIKYANQTSSDVQLSPHVGGALIMNIPYFGKVPWSYTDKHLRRNLRDIFTLIHWVSIETKRSISIVCAELRVSLTLVTSCEYISGVCISNAHVNKQHLKEHWTMLKAGMLFHNNIL